tara:strand:- start:198 stop:449 length:252 start_codon:yes stop_codon:yes gene_type:complete
MGFVTLEKSEKEELFKRKPYAMGKKELQQALDANMKEQFALRAYVKNLKESGGSKKDIKIANSVWLALKTIHTQLEGLHRRAK